MLSCVQLFVAPWTLASQAPLSTGFSRQEYWSGLPFPPPGDLLDPGIEPVSSVSTALQADFFYPLSHQGSPRVEAGCWQNWILILVSTPLCYVAAAPPAKR